MHNAITMSHNDVMRTLTVKLYGRQLSIPIVCFPRLKNATSEQILNYNLSGGGLGVHWDELDEDLYVPDLLLGITSIPDREHTA